MPNRLEGDLKVTGALVAGSMAIPSGAVNNAAVAGDAAISRSKLAQDALAIYPLPLQDFRVWDDVPTTLQSTSDASADDLAMVGGTFGTAPPLLQSGDVKAAGSVSKFARITWTVPPEFDEGETLQVRVRSAVLTTVADSSAAVDVVAYINDGDGGLSADMIATVEQDTNDLAYADHDFSLSTSILTRGDKVDMRIALNLNDAASGTTVRGSISEVSLLMDVRG